jgi:mRNA-degrading endonuclease RelE of RelBE toxin-antitoxin system
MNCRVIPSDVFEKEFKRLVRKYPSLKQEVPELENALLENPRLGTPLGNHCYKIRLAVKSKRKGKSGGMRVITWVIIQMLKASEEETLVNLVTMYDKTEYETLSPKDLNALLKKIRTSSRLPK